MPAGRTFIDTNIIIYAYDASSGSKHERAREILMELWNSGDGVLSTQVLQELFVCLTGKIAKPMGARQAREIISDLLKWDVVVNDGNSILNAIEIHLKYRYSFWDSMIISSAIRANATNLLSEDLSHGQRIQWLKILNPFLDETKGLI